MLFKNVLITVSQHNTGVSNVLTTVYTRAHSIQVNDDSFELRNNSKDQLFRVHECVDYFTVRQLLVVVIELRCSQCCACFAGLAQLITDWLLLLSMRLR